MFPQSGLPIGREDRKRRAPFLCPLRNVVKIELVELWEKSAGKSFKYYLVYENREVKGAFTKDDFLTELQKL